MVACRKPPSCCVLGRPLPQASTKIPLQLEENHVVPPSSQDEALASYSVSVEALRYILKSGFCPIALQLASTSQPG